MVGVFNPVNVGFVFRLAKFFVSEIRKRDGTGAPWTLKEILAITQEYEKRVNTRFLETTMPDTFKDYPTVSQVDEDVGSQPV